MAETTAAGTLVDLAAHKELAMKLRAAGIRLASTFPGDTVRFHVDSKRLTAAMELPGAKFGLHRDQSFLEWEATVAVEGIEYYTRLTTKRLPEIGYELREVPKVVPVKMDDQARAEA